MERKNKKLFIHGLQRYIFEKIQTSTDPASLIKFKLEKRWFEGYIGKFAMRE